MSEIMKFIKQFQNCCSEYRRLQRETDGTDQDIAHFFSSKNKSFLMKYKDEIKALSSSNCERPFMTFVNHFIYQ